MLKKRRSDVRLMPAAIYYSSAAWAKKRDIWPPLSAIAASDVRPPNFEPSKQQTSLGGSIPEHVRLQLDDLSSRTEHPYQPLHDGQIIRILELFPGTREKPLWGTFHYASLEHFHQSYEALSYVWGQKESRYYDEQEKSWMEAMFSIQCNNWNHRITQNLDDALRHIRLPSESRFIWVDALCINQNDDRERGHQVTLMSAVYRMAYKVLIWVTKRGRKTFWDVETQREILLPPEFEDARAQRAFGAVCEIVNTWRGDDLAYPEATYTTCIPGSQKRESFNTFDEHPPCLKVLEQQNILRKGLQTQYPIRRRRKLVGLFARGNAMDGEQDTAILVDAGIASTIDSAPDSQFWMSIAELFDLPWFWRVWVIQEAVLPKNAVVLWANTTIDWRWVGLAAAILRTSYHAICESVRIVGIYNAYVMYRLSSMSDIPPLELNFVQLLRLTRQFEVTDPRDRVYGLLGIKTQDNDPSQKLFLEPDYTITESQLWKGLAWKSIQQQGNLSILSSVQYTADAFESENARRNIRHGSLETWGTPESTLPSWVPHWDSAYRVTLAPWDTSDRFAAANGFPMHLINAYETDPDCLRLEGIKVGIVGYEGVFMWHDLDFSILLSNDLGSFFASEPGLRLLARTFTASRDPYGNIIHSSDEALAKFAAYIINLHDRYVASLFETHRRRDLDMDTQRYGFGRPYTQPNPREDDSWEDLNADSVRSNPAPPHTKNFQRIFKLHPDLEGTLRRLAQRGDPSRFREIATPICERRRLFLTLNGFLGIGPDTVREGDIVAVLSGGDVPFILRPVQSHSVPTTGSDHQPLDDKNRYLLVGESFVEGLMNGEAVEAATKQQKLDGPVPTSPIIHRILTQSNEQEDIPFFAPMSHSERRRKVKERFEQGRTISADMLNQHTQVKLEKVSLEIC
ncbi:hypothetical protein N0V90_009645 [Kalmusia sp. IMI 367209]|nr:hypothetical protein N0V90_009645 [Kalmusia sp. IMI 367209]